jgi:hypothetical protein
MAHSEYKRGTEPLADTTQDLGPFKGGRAFNLSVDERDFTNQACAELVWLTTTSITSFMSRACSCSVSSSSCSSLPKSLVDVAVARPQSPWLERSRWWLRTPCPRCAAAPRRHQHIDGIS